MRKTTLMMTLAVMALAITGTAFAAAGDSCNEAISIQKGSTYGNLGGGGSRWFVFDSTVNGRFPVNTSMPGTQFDTRIAVFGACGGAPIVEGVTGGGRRAHAMVDGFPGQRFYIEVGSMGGSGQFELAVNDPRLGPACVPTAGDGDCFLDNGTPECEDICGGPPCDGGCCEAICLADSFCCDTAWDQICADAAIALGTPCMAIPVELKNFSVGD
jgi:hypothetical protein